MDVEEELDRLMELLGGEGPREDTFCRNCGAPEKFMYRIDCPKISLMVKSHMLDRMGFLKKEYRR